MLLENLKLQTYWKCVYNMESHFRILSFIGGLQQKYYAHSLTF